MNNQKYIPDKAVSGGGVCHPEGYPGLVKEFVGFI